MDNKHFCLRVCARTEGVVLGQGPSTVPGTPSSLDSLRLEGAGMSAGALPPPLPYSQAFPLAARLNPESSTQPQDGTGCPGPEPGPGLGPTGEAPCNGCGELLPPEP